VAASVFPWEITLSPPARQAAESAQNHLRARVISLTTLGNRARVGLQAGQPLVAEITAKAAAELALEVGSEVMAGFKATATRLVAL
jgi:molybdopterin-binding protein